MAKITKERKSLAVGLLIFVAVVIAAAVMGLIMLSPVTEYVEGQAEADEYRVSSKVPGRVVRFYVREGDTVRRGDTLVVLDAPDVLAKLEQARAAKDAAQAKQDEAMELAKAVPVSYVIGDCDKPGNVQKCMRSAFGIASQI